MPQAAWPDDWPVGVDRVILEEVDSTSIEAARRVPTAPTWIMAHMQTAAKGRRGRVWTMPPGNFAASLIWRPEGTPAQLALRSFTASLALHDALTGLGVEGLSLKWPNDVLLDHRKLAGILLETTPTGHLILGIGLNLRAAPDASQVETGALAPVSLREASGLDIAPEQLLNTLAPAFAARETQLVTWGFAPIRTQWLAHAAGIGARITARLVTETVHGTFADVDEAGHLVMKTDNGPRHIAAGDVFFERTT